MLDSLKKIYDAALKRPCPSCKSRPGEPCVARGSRLVTKRPHWARIEKDFSFADFDDAVDREVSKLGENSQR